ncbi:hypothetical protein B7R22_05465 [Subtercola boreus]|uniref:Uncharacterized protein n=1 Tax=Subtercola boreus TaxID=120213 RepID=A0A3E0W133_9MICO|nr:hypothetical protein [Subtercola boreus]RFA15856.1 hypothetical protein B7R22_05465 [Subtercola boreus]
MNTSIISQLAQIPESAFRFVDETCSRDDVLRIIAAKPDWASLTTSAVAAGEDNGLVFTTWLSEQLDMHADVSLGCEATYNPGTGEIVTGPTTIQAWGGGDRWQFDSPQDLDRMSNSFTKAAQHARDILAGRTPALTREAERQHRDEVDAAFGKAQSADCDFRQFGCDGADHSPFDPEELWIHVVERRVFGEEDPFGEVSVEILYLSTNGSFVAAVSTTTQGEFTSNELRFHLDSVPVYAKFLREVAERVDTLNAALPTIEVAQ